MDKWHVKCQSGLEFIMLAGIIMFMFIVIFAVTSIKAIDLNNKQNVIIGEDIITKIQKEVNLAARVKSGYSREFFLPEKLGQNDYNISIAGNEVILSERENEFSRVIPPITGNITKGKNAIRKTNGVIYIN